MGLLGLDENAILHHEDLLSIGGVDIDLVLERREWLVGGGGDLSCGLFADVGGDALDDAMKGLPRQASARPFEVPLQVSEAQPVGVPAGVLGQSMADPPGFGLASEFEERRGGSSGSV